MIEPNSDVLTFELDELRCAVQSASVLQIIRAVKIYPLPGQPDFVAGAIDMRGAIVPVLDVRVRFGRAARPLAISDIFVIAQCRSQRVALWVDRVIDFVVLDVERFARREGLLVGSRSLQGVARLDDTLVVIHDVSAFLNQAQSDALAALMSA